MDFNDYSSPEHPLAWKPIAIIVGGIILVFFLVIGAIWFWRGRDVRLAQQAQTQSQLENERKIVQQGCADGEDPVVCAQRKQSALSTGNTKLCDGLKGESHNGCLWQLAEQTHNATVCDQLGNPSSKQTCSESVWLSIALASKSPADCDKIKNTTKATACREVIAGPVTAENCATRGGDLKQCEVFTVAEEANKKQDMRVCDTLAGDRVNSCKELVRVDDPDFDGLSSIQETGTYGSNPYKADTDGDGYTDGQEVKAGFNPNGPGKLKK